MNLPNKLTMLRILLVPVFMVLAGVTQYGTASYTTGAWYLAAGIVFAAASFTDYLDGYLARKWNLVTDCPAERLPERSISLWRKSCL